MQRQTHHTVEITINAGYQGATRSLYAIGASLVTEEYGGGGGGVIKSMNTIEASVTHSGSPLST